MAGIRRTMNRQVLFTQRADGTIFLSDATWLAIVTRGEPQGVNFG